MENRIRRPSGPVHPNPSMLLYTAKLIILCYDNFGENHTPLQRNGMAVKNKIFITLKRLHLLHKLFEFKRKISQRWIWEKRHSVHSMAKKIFLNCVKLLQIPSWQGWAVFQADLLRHVTLSKFRSSQIYKCLEIVRYWIIINDWLNFESGC